MNQFIEIEKNSVTSGEKIHTYIILKKFGKTPDDLTYEIQQKLKNNYNDCDLIVLIFEKTYVTDNYEVENKYEYNIIYNQENVDTYNKLFLKVAFMDHIIVFETDTEIDIKKILSSNIESFNENETCDYY